MVTRRTIYLTTGQAARQLGISRRMLRRAVDRGEIACARQTPGGWSLFLAMDVEAFAQRLATPLAGAHQRPPSTTLQEVEKLSLSRKGTPLWITLTISPVRDAADAPAFCIAVIEDSSARKQAEEALRQSEERFRLTSSGEEQDLVRGYDLSANSYMRKPVDFAQFTQAVQTMGLYWLVLNAMP